MKWEILEATYTDYTKKQISTKIKSEDGEIFPFYVSLESEDDSELYEFIKGKIDSKEINVVENDDFVVLEDDIRAKRNMLLSETDYLINADYPLSKEKKNEIKKYRQDLRDIPSQDGFPFEVKWPKKPEL